MIGGGIVGLFTALFHKRAYPWHHVVVLEKGAFPCGASVRNAGFACFGSPSELLADMKAEGVTAALDRVEMRWRGLNELRQELGDDAIGLEPTGGHEIYTEHNAQYTAVREGFDLLNDQLRPILGSRAFEWAPQQIKSFGLKGVIDLARTPLEAPIDSGRLMMALLRKAIAEGVLFRSHFEVTVLEEHPGHVEIRSSKGEQVLAAQVVMALNGYTRSLLPDADVIPARGQVVLTSPVQGPRPIGTFHYDEGFYYFRDFNGGVLLGGGRNLDIAGETTAEAGGNPLIGRALEELLKQVILPEKQFSIVQRWSGIMAFGKTSKTPLIERRSERTVIAARLGGMGVAIGILVGRKAAGLISAS